MTRPTAHSYLQVRVGLKAKRLMSEDALLGLVERPIEDILSGLREPLQIHPQPDHGLDLGVLERHQMRSLLEDFAVLIRPLSGAARDLFIHWSRHYEVLNMKTLVRGKLRGLSHAELRPRLFDLGHYAALDYDSLAGTDDIDELLRHLAVSPCADAARQVRHTLAAREAPFHLDAVLDRYYHSTLMTKATAIDSAELRHLAGALTDAKNLVWLLRYRFGYQLSPTETYFALTPAGALLRRGRLSRLVKLERFQEVLDALPTALAAALAGAPSAAEVEARLEARTRSEARTILTTARSVVARAFAYLILRQLDMERLLAVLRGKALGLGAEAMRYAAGVADSSLEPRAAHV